MFKKSAILFLCLIMFILCGCSENGTNESSSQPVSNTDESETSDVSSETSSETSSDVSSSVSSKTSSKTSSVTSKKTTKKSTDNIADGPDIDPPKTRQSGEFVNPLNGLKELSEEQTLMRPYAVMINNIKVAQSVQTGLSKAEIVYETEVEGGITRLMALFKDPTGVGRIGTVRSARYPYVDLALGHNAIYFHCGQDPNYCKPHLEDIDHINFNSGTYSKYSARIDNGLKREHTLYTTGADLQKAAVKHKFATTIKEAKPWVDFAEEPITPEGNNCNTVTVKFSASYITKFKYNAETEVYTRYSGDTLLKDYFTKETKTVTNVFVLLTDITFYPDNYHKKVALTSGDGYYITHGKYIPIKWSKGAAKNGFSFTDASGNPLTVNPGQSWVCISDKGRSAPSFS